MIRLSFRFLHTLIPAMDKPPFIVITLAFDFLRIISGIFFIIHSYCSKKKVLIKKFSMLVINSANALSGATSMTTAAPISNANSSGSNDAKTRTIINTLFCHVFFSISLNSPKPDHFTLSQAPAFPPFSLPA